MEGFTADQARRFTGCTPHQLRYWDRVHLVTPSVQVTRGRPGVRRLYSFRDLVSLKVVRSLLDGGMSLQRVRKAYEYLRKKGALEEQLSEVQLVTDGQSIFNIAASEGQLMDALKEGQMAFFMCMEDVAQGLQTRGADYLYDRQGFISALREAESGLESQLDASSKERLRAAR
jgi:DNA-binding transcriptional MerR regulator